MGIRDIINSEPTLPAPDEVLEPAEAFELQRLNEVSRNQVNGRTRRRVTQEWMSGVTGEMEKAARTMMDYNAMSWSERVGDLSDMSTGERDILLKTMQNLASAHTGAPFHSVQQMSRNEVLGKLDTETKTTKDLDMNLSIMDIYQHKMMEDPNDPTKEVSTGDLDKDRLGRWIPGPDFRANGRRETRARMYGSEHTFGRSHLPTGTVLGNIGASELKQHVENGLRRNAAGNTHRLGYGLDDWFEPNILQYIDDWWIKDDDRKWVPPAFREWDLEFHRVLAREMLDGKTWNEAILTGFEETLLNGPYGFEFPTFANGKRRVFKRWPISSLPDVENVSAEVYVSEYMQDHYLKVWQDASSVDFILKNMVTDNNAFVWPTDYDADTGFVAHSFKTAGSMVWTALTDPLSIPINIYDWAMNVHENAVRIRRGIELEHGEKGPEQQAANYLMGVYSGLLGLSVPQNYRMIQSVLNFPPIDIAIEYATGERRYTFDEDEINQELAENPGAKVTYQSKVFDETHERFRGTDLIPQDVRSETTGELRSSPNAAQRYMRHIARWSQGHQFRLVPSADWNPRFDNYTMTLQGYDNLAESYVDMHQVVPGRGHQIVPISVDPVAWASDEKNPSGSVAISRAKGKRHSFVNQAIQKGVTQKGLTMAERMQRLDEDEIQYFKDHSAAQNLLALRISGPPGVSIAPTGAGGAVDPYAKAVREELSEYLSP